MGRALPVLAWHETPPPAPGYLKARRTTQAAALMYVVATVVYVVFWVERMVDHLCFGRDDGPPCPSSPAGPAQWLTTGRWVAWSAGALLVLVALVFAGRASAGRSTAAAVWRALSAAIACGVLFSLLVLAGP